MDAQTIKLQILKMMDDADTRKDNERDALEKLSIISEKIGLGKLLLWITQNEKNQP